MVEQLGDPCPLQPLAHGLGLVGDDAQLEAGLAQFAQQAGDVGP